MPSAAISRSSAPLPETSGLPQKRELHFIFLSWLSAWQNDCFAVDSRLGLSLLLHCYRDQVQAFWATHQTSYTARNPYLSSRRAAAVQVAERGVWRAPMLADVAWVNGGCRYRYDRPVCTPASSHNWSNACRCWPSCDATHAGPIYRTL